MDYQKTETHTSEHLHSRVLSGCKEDDGAGELILIHVLTSLNSSSPVSFSMRSRSLMLLMVVVQRTSDISERRSEREDLH